MRLDRGQIVVRGLWIVLSSDTILGRMAPTRHAIRYSCMALESVVAACDIWIMVINV